MSLTRKIGQNFIWRGVYLASMLLSNILFARVLGANASGSFYFVINNISLLILLAGFCLETSFVYFGSSGKIAPGKLIVAGLVWAMFSGIAGWIFGTIGLSTSPFGFPGWIWALFTVSFVLINYCSALFNAKQDFKTYNILLTLVNLLFILGLLGIDFLPAKLNKYLPLGDADFIDLVTFAYVFTVILQGIVVLIAWLIKNAPISFEWPQNAEWAQIIRYASLSLTANLVFFLVYRVDYWFVNYFQNDATQLGNYIQVSKLGQLFIMLPSIIATVVFPATALSVQPTIRKEIMRLCRLFFSFYFLILVIISAIGYWLFPFVFGASFSQMYLAFAALCPGIIALSIQSLLAAWFAGRNQVRFNVYGAMLALLMIVLFNVILIPKFGINGAAIASSIGYIAYCVFSIYKFQKQEEPSEKFSFIATRDDIRWLGSIVGIN